MRSGTAEVINEYSFSFPPLMKGYEKEHEKTKNPTKTKGKIVLSFILLFCPPTSVMSYLTPHLTHSDYNRKTIKI